MTNQSNTGSGKTGRRAFMVASPVLGFLAARALYNIVYEDNDRNLEERLAGTDSDTPKDRKDYLQSISEMKFTSPKDVARLIHYSKQAHLIIPQDYRTVHEAYGRALESIPHMDDPLRYLALLSQASVLSQPLTNILLPGEETNTSIAGTVKSNRRLNFNFRLFNLLREFENYEKAEQIYLQNKDLPVQVDYGLGNYGKIPDLHELRERMIRTIDNIMQTIQSSDYESVAPRLVQKRRELLQTLPLDKRESLGVNNLSPRQQYFYRKHYKH